MRSPSAIFLSAFFLSMCAARCTLDRKGLGAGNADADGIVIDASNPTSDAGPSDSGFDSGTPDANFDAGPECDSNDDCPDDGNPCTLESCELGDCVFGMPEGTSCDDGVFCNGVDLCSHGTCMHDAPCAAALCHEEEERCEACAAAADCGTTTLGEWGACTGFSDACDETGTQSRFITSYSCSAKGECEQSVSTLSQECVRDTDGLSCGTSETRNERCDYASTCTNSGTRVYEVRSYVCERSDCEAVDMSMSEMNAASCLRNTNGTSCNDGNACSVNETCMSGACGGGAERDCNDNNACTNDSCSGGCVNEPYSCLLGLSCIERCDDDECEPLCIML